MSNCSDCNWFSTRESHCSKYRKTVKPHDAACDGFWMIVRPIPVDDELALDKICTDCLEKGYSLFNESKFCPICGKELRKEVKNEADGKTKS